MSPLRHGTAHSRSVRAHGPCLPPRTETGDTPASGIFPHEVGMRLTIGNTLATLLLIVTNHRGKPVNYYSSCRMGPGCWNSRN